MSNNIFFDMSDFDERVVTTSVEDNEFAKFLVDGGLYDTIKVTQQNVLQLADLLEGYVKLNVFCPRCNETRVFSADTVKAFYENKDVDGIINVGSFDVGNGIFREQRSQCIEALQDINTDEPWRILSPEMKKCSRVLVIKFVCAMRDSHYLDFVISFDGHTIRKIGQYPTVADLSKQDFDTFSKVMSNEDTRELKRAVGLHAQGIGIGSFAYLRRVYERMIADAAKEAIDNGAMKEDDLKGLKEKEKINLLSNYLPDFLVNNKVFYGIVSKGIHELSEKECLEYFPVLYDFLMMVFEQKEEERNREQRKKSIQSSLGKISSDIA